MRRCRVRIARAIRPCHRSIFWEASASASRAPCNLRIVTSRSYAQQHVLAACRSQSLCVNTRVPKPLTPVRQRSTHAPWRSMISSMRAISRHAGRSFGTCLGRIAPRAGVGSTSVAAAADRMPSSERTGVVDGWPVGIPAGGWSFSRSTGAEPTSSSSSEPASPSRVSTGGGFARRRMHGMSSSGFVEPTGRHGRRFCDASAIARAGVVASTEKSILGNGFFLERPRST